MDRHFVRKGKIVSIKKPTEDELSYIEWLWGDESTMKEVGGIVPFPKDKRKNWYERMVFPGDGCNFYCLIFNEKKQPVGEVSFHHYNSVHNSAELNIKIAANERGKGYAAEALNLFLTYFFNELAGEVMEDPVAIENIAGQNVLKKMGFKEKERTDEYVLLSLDKNVFNRMYQHEKLN